MVRAASPQGLRLRRLSGALAALLAVVCLALGVSPAAAAPGDLVLVAATGQDDYGEVDALQHRPAISADGRFIAYVPQSAGEGDPLFMRDMQQPAPVQIVTPSEPVYPGYDSATPVLSDSGRYLAFASQEATLSDEDTDRGPGAGGFPDPTVRIGDIFRYDRLTGKMTLVSRRSGRRGEASNNDSYLPSISGDGRFVAYSTESTNLAPGKRPIVDGIYRRDLRTEANRLVSGPPGIQFWTPNSYSPDISGNGRRVAFSLEYSRRPYDPKHPPKHPFKWLKARHQQIVIRDLAWKRPRLVSQVGGLGGAIANEDCSQASVSRNGRFVAFVTEADNLVPGDDNGAADVFVRDMQSKVTTLVSRAGFDGTPGNAESVRPSISADGRYVAFLTLAGNLAAADADDKPDVYVKDLRTGQLTLVTRGLGGQPSNGRFSAPTITPDGTYVAFGSTSSNISAAVTNHDHSFFRYQLR